MSINLSALETSRPPFEVDILDKRGDETGLTFTAVHEEDDQYQRAFRHAQDRMSRGKPKAKEIRELNEKLFMARIKGWKWTGKALAACGDEAPEFNQKNLKDVLYGQGEDSAAIRIQLTRSIGQSEEVFSEE